ncbi:MAG: hypothetical protein J6I66_10945 [Lachnospiraceae bacterium]|nr:hypothetical protein [Lachnospiraceae bacterium]MBP3755363.1 hypothetical protein [Lachnospiraceae bacterium]
MEEFIIFSNSFLSYLLLMIIIVVVAALGFTVGRILRNKKDSKSAQDVSAKTAISGSDN